LFFGTLGPMESIICMFFMVTFIFSVLPISVD
jgi:hypothetical protein